MDSGPDFIVIVCGSASHRAMYRHVLIAPKCSHARACEHTNLSTDSRLPHPIYPQLGQNPPILYPLPRACVSNNSGMFIQYLARICARDLLPSHSSTSTSARYLLPSHSSNFTGNILTPIRITFIPRAGFGNDQGLSSRRAPPLFDIVVRTSIGFRYHSGFREYG